MDYWQDFDLLGTHNELDMNFQGDFNQFLFSFLRIIKNHENAEIKNSTLHLIGRILKRIRKETCVVKVKFQIIYT